MIKVGIQGGAGIVGGELIRIISNHPNVELIAIQSNSFANQSILDAHPDCLHLSEVKFTANLSNNLDVVFLCGGHGNSKHILNEFQFSQSTKLIDLSNDFRIQSTYLSKSFEYGLVELNKSKIQSANYIANPGCFATAIQLTLLPIIHEIQDEIHVSGITGSTGAGIQLQDSLHFTKRSNNIAAYKSLKHQHIPEVIHNLNMSKAIHFMPLKGDFTRGIFCSMYTSFKKDFKVAKQLFEEYYANCPFITVIEGSPSLKQVVNTNHAIIGLELESGKLIVHSAIDNLIKGAAGQAVQNMNLMFNFPETAGLLLKPSAY